MLNFKLLLMTVLVFPVLWSVHTPAETLNPPEPTEILQQASQAVEEMEGGAPLSLYINLAEAYKEIGRKTDAEETLFQAAKYARAHSYMAGLAQIAKAQAEMGNVSEAKITLQEALKIDEPSRPDEIIPVIQILYTIGDVEAALSSAKGIKDTRTKDEALKQIAKVQAGSGQYAAAFQTADLAEMEATKTYITFAIAVEQVWAGQLQEAQETATAIKQKPLYIAFLARLGEAQSEAGDQAGAKKTIEVAQQAASLIKGSDDEWNHDGFALKQITAAQTRIGDLDGAVKTANRVRNSRNKDLSLIRISEIQIQKGDFKGALETAEGLSDGNREYVLENIGLAQTQAGDIPGALQTAELIQNDYNKTSVLDEIAVAQAKSGDWASATATYDKARTYYSPYFPMVYREEGLIEMTEAQAARGEVQEAYQWALNHKSRKVRVLALIGVARGMEKNRQTNRKN